MGGIVRQIMYSDTDGGVIYDRTSQNVGSSWSDWVRIVTFDQIPWDVVETDAPQTFTQPQTFSIAPTITDASKDKGDNQAATMADLKSVENSAWHQLSVNISETNYTCTGLILYREINSSTLEITGSVLPTSTSESLHGAYAFPILQLSNYRTLSSSSFYLLNVATGEYGDGLSGYCYKVIFNGNTAYLNVDRPLYDSLANRNPLFMISATNDISPIMGAPTVNFTK